MKSRNLALAALTVAAAVALTGCGAPSAGGSAPHSAGLSIAFVPKQLNNPVFDTIATGGQEAAKELGGQFLQVGPSDATGPAQIPYIQSLSSKRVGAIAISANDPNAVAPALKAAMKQGTKVVGFDSPPASDARDVFVADSDPAGVGQTLAEMICTDVEGCSGKIAILSATSTSPVQNEWIAAMKKTIAAESKYAGLDIVKIAYGNDDPQASTTATQGLLSAYPDLKGIVAPTSVGIVSAAQVLEQTGKAGKIELTGLATPNSMRKYVKDGTAKNFALWNLKDLGYLTYYAAALELQGKITGKKGETFTAGRLGHYTVGADGVVVLGKPFVYDAKNIDQFHF
ncbi:rhamnose ABC transporter substrate-binding protein [uncultured Leifsonia sp.]|uniref:rhamnose ABC transporter substrate-binding protein n=1 Tax=uncultured Leifsonia sp. TaxID=340359 RepID=UPI0025FAD7C5|nr:rhamnose ABC transporter substrate-binding protein [uncultured Leifsonia sp.]